MLGLRAMQPLRATVKNGRITLDEPTDLPEGTTLYLVPAESPDALDEADERALEDFLERSIEAVQQGRVVPAERVLPGFGRRKR